MSKIQTGFRKGQKVKALGGYFEGCEGKVTKVGTMIRVQFPFLCEGITYSFGRNTLQIIKRKKKTSKLKGTRRFAKKGLLPKKSKLNGTRRFAKKS